MKKFLKGIFNVIPEWMFVIIILGIPVYFGGIIGDYFAGRANSSPTGIAHTPEWSLVSESEVGTKYYFDQKNMGWDSSGGSISIFELYDNLPLGPLGESKESRGSTVALVKIDCETLRFKVTSGDIFAKPMGKGKKISSGMKMSEWENSRLLKGSQIKLYKDICHFFQQED